MVENMFIFPKGIKNARLETPYDPHVILKRPIFTHGRRLFSRGGMHFLKKYSPK